MSVPAESAIPVHTSPYAPMTSLIPQSRPERPAGIDSLSPSSLYSGSIPSVSHLDDYYSSRREARGYDCKEDWSRYRNVEVTQRPSNVSMETLEANAEEAGLPINKLRRMLATFLANRSMIRNQRYVTVIDFDRESDEERMFVIDLIGDSHTPAGTIRKYHVAHGKNSGGIGAEPTRFSNRTGSLRSSLGCALATYSAEPNGNLLRDSRRRHKLLFQGFESTNDRMCYRHIFMHPADYVDEGGRSYGCPAVETEDKDEVYNQISGGGLVCSYADD